MSALSCVTLPLKRHGSRQATDSLIISLLPGQAEDDESVAPLVCSKEQAVEPSVQLLEGREYRYEVKGSTEDLSFEPKEIFFPDTLDGVSGRLRPGNYVGLLPVQITDKDGRYEQVSLEVRSRKLNYLSEFQWMLRDLAREMAEVVMHRFSAVEQQFSPDDCRDAATLYQRFAFLRSLISSEEFRAATGQILNRPHVSWLERHEEIRPGQGMRASSRVARQMAQPGPRSHWPGGTLSTIPNTLARYHTETTLDTTPNRFVKFALMRWRGVISQIAEILNTQKTHAFAQRGLLESRALLDELDALISEELFREVGNIHRFPAEDQVLQKREGYRDVMRAYVQFEVASKLAWSGGEDVYGAGQRDVATLYEYWVFLKLGEIIASICERSFNFSDLIEVQSDGLNVNLKKGKTRVFKGYAQRLERQLDVELWFNKPYRTATGVESSWSRSMRPDYSLKISPEAGEKAAFEPVLLHFDAKYRIDSLREIFGDTTEDDDPAVELPESNAGAGGGVLRTDLLKMHAYRDAIRRSAGAYVIYPGDEKELHLEYHELLPGLGAFPLRPTSTGDAIGSLTITEFLEDALEHIALQISQHERGRYWIKETYSVPPRAKYLVPTAPFLGAPPADTSVLLGYVRNKAHWSWVEKTGLYNLRADKRRGSVGLGSKELACDLTVLSCPDLSKTAVARVTGNPELHTRAQLEERGYPSPGGDLYYCLPIEIVRTDNWQKRLPSDSIEELRQSKTATAGQPVTVSWLDLITWVSKP